MEKQMPDPTEDEESSWLDGADLVKLAIVFAIGPGAGGVFGTFYGENAGIAMFLLVAGGLFVLRHIWDERRVRLEDEKDAKSE